jgi:rhodanese-related sulfurtransferase
LYALMESDAPVVVLDVRSETARRLDARRIPRAWPVDPSAPDSHLEEVPRDREIVLYCS